MARICPECKGKKGFRCDRCKGTGRFFGVPLLGKPSSPCEKCGASGKLTCRRCDGRGRV